MGRAPNPAAPRVSAHVVPKVHSAPVADDEENENEKTTIESGWEDEASTTVEQGDDKVQPLAAKAPLKRSITNITSTNGNSQLEELTVDDQRANAAIALMSPPANATLARLVITAGNDSGQELEIRPGKAYTIGRSIDNDVVLTDIAVSRKHFDLVHEVADGWILVDRGSGNGTLVNGALEDQPFVLANGDVIEIGNTIFRFEAPNAQARDLRGFDVDMDEEPSTVAGRSPPVSRARARPESVRAQVPPIQQPAQPMPVRAKTQPPPPPLRPRAISVAPQSYSSPLSSQPSAMPMNHRAPDSMPPLLPTTLPGQAMPMPMPQPQMLGNGANQQQMLHHLVSSHAMPSHPSSQAPWTGQITDRSGSHQHHMVAPSSMPREAQSTALVPPTPYSGMPLAQQMPMPYEAPQLSRRTKLIVGGAVLALVAAVITVAIVKSGKAPEAAVPVEGSATTQTEQMADTTDTKPETATKTIDTKPKTTETVAKTLDTKPAKPLETKPLEVPRPIETKLEVPKPIETKPKVTEVAKLAEPKPKVVAEPKPKPVVAEPKPKVVVVEPKPKVVEPKPKPVVEPKPKVVAAADSARRDVSGPKTKASEQYRAKNFAGAAATLRAAAPTASAADAKDLKSLAKTYEQFGQSYNSGMLPGAKATDAWQALRLAKNFDREGAFQAEIKTKLGEVAPKAAGLYISRNDLENASKAITDAETYGGSTKTTENQRKALESKANDLYAEAAKEMDGDSAAAKQKLQLILNILPSKSPIATKAKRLLEQ